MVDDNRADVVRGCRIYTYGFAFVPYILLADTRHSRKSYVDWQHPQWIRNMIIRYLRVDNLIDHAFPDFISAYS